MDFNYYFFRQLVAQKQADAATSAKAREAHQQLADAYRRLIEHERRKRGSPPAALFAAGRVVSGG
jgi:hypothetical protein